MSDQTKVPEKLTLKQTIGELFESYGLEEKSYEYLIDEILALIDTECKEQLDSACNDCERIDPEDYEPQVNEGYY